MAPKRRKEVEDGDEEAPASKSSRENPDISRKAKFKAHLTALNSQFAEWVYTQAGGHASDLWMSGVRDYVSYAEKLLGDFKDVIDAEKGGRASTGSTVGGSWGSGSTGGASSSLFGSGAANGAVTGGSGGGLFSFGAASGTTAGTSGTATGSGGAGLLDSSAREAFSNQNGPFGATISKGANGDAPADKPAEPVPAITSSTNGTSGGLFSFGAAPPASTTATPTGTTPTFGSTASFGTSGVFNSTVTVVGNTASGLEMTGAAAAASSSAASTSTTTAPAFGFSLPASRGADKAAGGMGAAAATPNSFWQQPFSFGSTTSVAGGDKADKADDGAKDGNRDAGKDTGVGSVPAASTTTTATPAGGFFSFNASSTMPVPSFAPTSGGGFGGFNFGGASATTAPATAAPAEEEGEEEQPQKYESAVETSEESGTIHYKSKSKFYKMPQPGQWDVMGVGQLMVRTRKEDPNKPFITFTTEAGRVLYCANVHKTMKLIHNEAKHTVAWSASWATEAGATPALVSVMAQLPKGQSSKFLEAVEQLQAAMSAS